MADDAPPPMPRWVKIALVAGALVALAAIAVALLAPDGHGPRLHG